VEIKAVEKKYNNLKNRMKQKKGEELKRIGKEFLLNNYEARFRVH
jgi:hypothetical protein